MGATRGGHQTTSYRPKGGQALFSEPVHAVTGANRQMPSYSAAQWQELGLWGQMGAWIPAQPCPSWCLRKGLHLSELQFLCCKMRVIVIPITVAESTRQHRTSVRSTAHIGNCEFPSSSPQSQVPNGQVRFFLLVLRDVCSQAWQWQQLLGAIHILPAAS